MSVVDGGGMAEVMRDMALSMKMPVGSPPASRTMRPPGGSGVTRVTWAAFMAARLAQPAWPSTRSTKTGFEIWSRSACVGNAPPGKRF